MGTISTRGLVNSISRFIHLSACQTIKPDPIQRDFTSMVATLKLLKPVIDEIVDFKIPSERLFTTEIEELDIIVNEARELLERLNPKMSKILIVLQSYSLMVKTKKSALTICRKIKSSSLLPNSTFLQRCVQDLGGFNQNNEVSEIIEEVFRDMLDELPPKPAHLLKIVELLCLKSNEGLLSESMALEKERSKAELRGSKEDLISIEQIIDLISHIRRCMIDHNHLSEVNGKLIPPEFFCQLSLEVMRDPVIVASGQTYERSFIQKWLDQGLRICPIIRQPLSHINLIPNYTVKALIAHWHGNKYLKQSPAKSTISSLFGSRGVPKDVYIIDSYQDLCHGEITPYIPPSDVRKERQIVEISAGNDDLPGMNYSAVNSHDKLHEVAIDCLIADLEPHFEDSCSHSRSESSSSTFSSLDDVTSRALNKSAQLNVTSDETLPVESYSQISQKTLLAHDLCFSPQSSFCQNCISPLRVQDRNDCHPHQNDNSSPSEAGSEDLINLLQAQNLTKDLSSNCREVQINAAAEVRSLAKYNKDNRVLLAEAGVIGPLISLLHSGEDAVQRNAVTALLNLSISYNIKTLIYEARAIEPLICVMKFGSPEARENSAATLYSLSALEQFRSEIGRCGVFRVLVELLRSGTLRAKKDAAGALFNLSICYENKARIVQAGAVKNLVELIQTTKEMADKVLAILASLSTVSEGCTAIGKEGGVPHIAAYLETGSSRGKENAASTLLQLCANSQKLSNLVLQEGVVPPLVALSQSGTPRAKEKAQQLLSHFRGQRGTNNVKGKSYY